MERTRGKLNSWQPHIFSVIMDILLEEHKKLLLLLLKHQVDFMLIGGYAVIYYGYERSTGDMDLWLKPDNTNRDKLIEALTELGIIAEDIALLKNLDFTETRAFHIGSEPKKVDFLTKVQGVQYEEADAKKKYFPLKDKQVPIVHYEHLILMKMLSNRIEDKADVERLQNINKYNDKNE